MNKLFGIYEGIVTDNRYFLSTGKIKVRIKEMLITKKMPTDLTQNFNINEFRNDYANDFDCTVFSVIGGGKGFGTTHIPQVNSVGIVQFLNGNINKPVWMGSHSRSIYKDMEIQEVVIPSDIPEVEGANAFVNGERQFNGNSSTIVLRTKKTFPIKTDPSGASWDDKRTENLIVISEDSLFIRHFTKWEEKNGVPTATKYQDFEMSSVKGKVEGYEDEVADEIPNISLKAINLEDKVSSILNLNDQFCSLSFLNEKDNITNLVKADELSVEVSSVSNRGSSTTKITPTENVMTSGSSSVTITDDDVILDGKKSVRLSTEGDVIIGDGGNRILTIPDDGVGNNIPIQTVSNHTLYAAKKARA